MTDARNPSAEATPAPGTARVLAASPILFVADVVKAAEYYADKLSGYRPNATFDGHFHVDDADALYAEFKASGADIVCPPEDMLYLMRELQVRDLDGHLLAFAHDTSPGAEV